MNVVIVGGGFAGLKTALELANKPQFSVTLISKNADFEYHGALYRSATGHSPLEVVLRIGEVLKKASNVNFVIDEIVALHHSSQCIEGVTGARYSYDRLVLAMGNEKNFFGIEGMSEYAHTMYTIHDTMALRRDLVTLFTSQYRRPVSVSIIGAGPSGVELAGDMKRFAEMVASTYHLPTKHVTVELIEGADRVLPTLSPRASDKAMKRLKKLGVRVMLSQKVSKCAPNSITLERAEHPTDMVVWTAGSRAVDIFAKYPELFELQRGKVVVDEYLRVPKAPTMYVAGDNALTRYSGMAQTAIHDGRFIAANLIREHTNEALHTYRAKMPIYVVPIGGKWAVSQINGKVRSGRLGWSVRRKADLWVYKNFEPFKSALASWRKANKRASF